MTHEVLIMGRVMGTASDYTTVSDTDICYYDFQPDKGCDLPSGTLYIDFVSGDCSVYDETDPNSDDMDVVYSGPILNVLVWCLNERGLLPSLSDMA